MNEINSFLLSAVESSTDAIIALTLDGKVAYCNPAAENIYGYSATELKGVSIACLSLPERSDEISLILDRISNGSRVPHFQTIHLKKNGVTIPVSLSISPIIDAAEKIIGASFIARDLSHQLSFEKTLQESEQRYQKLKTSLELAKHVQQCLLPSTPGIESPLDISFMTLYCEALGGDYYDFFSTDDASGKVLGLAVGDVSGHGTAAALLMAMAKGSLQAELEHAPLNLADVLRHLNRFFYQETGSGGMFMTLFLARIEIGTFMLHWCSAGQGPVYIYHPEAQFFEELDCSGPPLGVLPDDVYLTKTKQLKAGDILIVGTDGLWEARNGEGAMFSVERFRQLLASWHHKSAEEICRKMLAKVKSFTAKNALDDDMTLIIIKIPSRLCLTGSSRK